MEDNYEKKNCYREELLRRRDVVKRDCCGSELLWKRVVVEAGRVCTNRGIL